MTDDDSWMFVNWIDHHGRSEDLAAQLSARAVYITGGSGNRIIRYFRQWRETVRIVKQASPTAIFVMQPPVLALWATQTAAPKNALIVGDLHTGVFTDRKWAWAATGILRSLRRRGGAVIVTNESLARRCRSAGTTTHVLDDAVPRRVGSQPRHFSAESLSGLRADKYVLVPLAYAADEPLEEILAAAGSDTNLTWVFTGRAPDAVRAKAPKNVRFSGFVSKEDYNWLAANAGVIVACTVEEDTMQRAGYEAVSWERPLVTSRTEVLVDYFGDAAEFAAPISVELAAAVRRAFESRASLIESISDLGVRKRREHDDAIENLRSHVNRAVDRCR